MNLIKTQSFELAVNTKGNENAEKIALFLPGRLDTKDYANFSSHLEYLASKGFFAISFDPPGTWDSPGGIELFTTTNYIKAVNEVIEYYGNKPTLLFGHSRGGATAILAGTLNPSVKALVVIMATYGKPSAPSAEALEKGFNFEDRDLPPGTQITKEQKEFKLPLNYFKDGGQYDPGAIFKTCTKPKLIFFSKQDEYTEPQRVNEVYEAIPEPKMKHELNIEHDYRYHPEVFEEVNKIMGQFLEKYWI